MQVLAQVLLLFAVRCWYDNYRSSVYIRCRTNSNLS